MTQVQAIPQGYHSLTPYMTIRNCAEAIEFYKKAFGAVQRVRIDGEDHKVVHAELKIGDSILMMTDENIKMDHKGPEVLKGTPVSVLLYVENVDDVFNRAVKEGATVISKVEDQYFGDRMGTLKDPYGHIWSISTHIEDVSPEEMEKRMKKIKH